MQLDECNGNRLAALIRRLANSRCPRIVLGVAPWQASLSVNRSWRSEFISLTG
ncbi:hypothetical protein GK091_29035 [Spirosoma agri]|uniref:Uncharacterized protein n=1 Tax=Spirosoma agri TaxID=1987381 RepID=A0A6M0ISC5_9BACT|nr:hypothetical protein [Spirosoma agri]NEU70942.1 hypothetical protein [Spirosoma agri]